MALSPAIWWGDQETRKAIEAYVISQTGIKGYLYINIGSESGVLRDVYDEFVNFIRRNRTLDLKLYTDEFNNVGHDFTVVSGLYNALKGLNSYQKTLGM